MIDKNTGNVVETRTITASSGIQKFTTTATASKGELTYQVDYDKGTPASKAEPAQPFLQYGYEVGASIQALVAPGHNLTPDEQKLYDAVYAARTSTDIINVVEPAYNGRTITDTNSKIPRFVNKTTYYRVEMCIRDRVMSVGFGIPAFAVDTHVERICKHHDIVKKSATPLEVEKRVMDVLPPEKWLARHP